MTRMSRLARIAIPSFLAASALVFAGHRMVLAADHLDPPARTDPSVDPMPDKAADIADLYAFHDADKLVIALTFSGPQATDLPASYDRDMLYTINLSNSGKRTDAEFPIRVRFGFDPDGHAGVEVTGLPREAGGAMIGPVERNLERNGFLIRAGLFDDPFFFDLQGFRETRQTGELAFDSHRNFFAGQNLTAIVIQMPRSAIENGDHPVDIWATTARLPENG